VFALTTAASTLLVTLLTLAGYSAPPPRVRIDVDLIGMKIGRQFEHAAMEEVAGIWSEYGVDVRLRDAHGERPDAIELTVVVAECKAANIAPNALGSISFVNDQPKPLILMYPSTIVQLATAQPVLGRSESEWPIGLREIILGRVFGRALAHEIGHYLLRTREHSSVGLMKANQPVPDLVSADRRLFVLSSDETARLGSLLTSTIVTAR
jgi:hypothetical protein